MDRQDSESDWSPWSPWSADDNGIWPDTNVGYRLLKEEGTSSEESSESEDGEDDSEDELATNEQTKVGYVGYERLKQDESSSEGSEVVQTESTMEETDDGGSEGNVGRGFDTTCSKVEIGSKSLWEQGYTRGAGHGKRF